MAEKQPKIALVHDHLVQDGGAERVLRVLSSMYPEAPIFTLLQDKRRFKDLHGEVRTSFLQRIPILRKRYRWLLPLMPVATEHYNLKDFDIVISSASAFSKGIVAGSNTTHICYCHTPTRYLWTDSQEYVESQRLPGVVKKVLMLYLSRLRQWDRLAADRVDVFLANSSNVKNRIRKFYRKDSLVVYPPVDTHEFQISDLPKTYFVAGGRMVPYKRFDIIVEAANRLKAPLRIFGDGPAIDELKKKAKPNIEFMGRVTDEEKAGLYANAIAYLHPQEEDFGITPVEAMASGTPVIAYGRGGATESVVHNKTGILFEEQTWESLADAMMKFEDHTFNPHEIKEHAEIFSRSQFEDQIRQIVEKVS